MVPQIAVDRARFGARCSALRSGFADTAFNAGFESRMGGRGGLEKSVTDTILVGRRRTAGEPADSPVYVLADKPSFMTGHALAVDRGRVALSGSLS